VNEVLNILFWNLHGKSIEKIVAECMIENDISMATFSEFNGIDFNELEKLLFKQYHLVQSLCMNPSHIQGDIHTRLIVKNSIEAVAIQEQGRYSIFKIKTGIQQYILVAIHLQDRRNKTTIDRINTINRIKSDIEKFEKELKCNSTIVIGDFNANPYDEELLSVHGFNAVLFKDIILSNEYRKYEFLEYKHFYNPILDFISASSKMHGSFYHTGDSYTPIWHCIDQILLRKDLVQYFGKLKYIMKIGDTDLIKTKKPDDSISDHLPLLATIKEEVDLDV
jgi:endonuclease/exonuclease/phosphatase family metal-dependent hydrolase